MPITKRDKQIIFWATKSMNEEIEQIVARDGIARADFVRAACREAIYRDKEKQAERAALLLKLKEDTERLGESAALNKSMEIKVDGEPQQV